MKYAFFVLSVLTMNLAHADIPSMSCQISNQAGQVEKSFELSPRRNCCDVSYFANNGQLDFRYVALATTMEVSLSQNPYQPFQPLWGAPTLKTVVMVQSDDGNIRGELNLDPVEPGSKLVCQESKN